MGLLSAIVNVTITRGTKTVSLPGFGTALFLGPNATSLKSYSSFAGVKADFTSAQVEYKAALAYFSQANQPTALLIGKRTATVAQVVTFTPDATTQAIEPFTVTINGVAYTITSDITPTATEVVTAMKAAITDTSVTLTGTTTLIVTAAAAGSPFTYAAGTRMAAVLTTASNGIQDDINTADAAAVAAGFDWYMLAMASRVAAEIEAAAQLIEGMFKMFGGCTVDSGVIDPASTTDVASILKGKSYLRTWLMYSADQVDFPEMALMGAVLPLDAGSETWKFKTLGGISPDDQLTASQVGALETKNVNFYQTTGGIGITAEGKISSGDYIDVTRFIDWYTVQMQAQIFTRLANLPKVPFTDEGVSQIEGDIRAVNQRAERAGGLAKGSSFVIVPLVADVSPTDKGNRTLPSVQFGGELAGAIHKVTLSGTLSI